MKCHVFGENNNGGSKWECKWVCKYYQLFHDGNSTLNKVTNIHTKAGILLKVTNVFFSEILN